MSVLERLTGGGVVKTIDYLAKHIPHVASRKGSDRSRPA